MSDLGLLVLITAVFSGIFGMLGVWMDVSHAKKGDSDGERNDGGDVNRGDDSMVSGDSGPRIRKIRSHRLRGSGGNSVHDNSGSVK
jgi:hypothetical protein